jgi:hypothetical protein
MNYVLLLVNVKQYWGLYEAKSEQITMLVQQTQNPIVFFVEH